MRKIIANWRDPVPLPVRGIYADERKRRKISVCKLGFISMTTTDTQESGEIKGDSRHLNWEFPHIHICVKWVELNRFSDNPPGRFTATDILMLMPAAHMVETPCLKCFKCH